MPRKPRKPTAAPRDRAAAGADRAYTQPSARSFTTWTPAQLKLVEAAADSGYLGRVADLCETILGDDRIQELCETRAGALLGADLTFEESLRRQTGVAKLADQLEEDWWDAFPEDELSQFLYWGRILGVSFGELVWTEDPRTGRIVPRLKFWHPKHFRWDWKVQKFLLQLEVSSAPIPITNGDGQWIVYTPYGRYRPWAHGLWRGLSRWWMLKSYAILDWGVHSEKSSKLVVTSAENSTAPQRKALVAEIYEMAKDAVISLPPGFSMELLELSANTSQIYLAQIEATNLACAIAILGQNLTTEVQGGSYAAAQTHLKVELRRAKSDKQTLATVIRREALEQWAEYNFGDRTLAPWPIWHIEPAEEQGTNATTLATVASALTELRASGFTVDEKTLEEKYGVKLVRLTQAEVDSIPVQKLPEPAESVEADDDDGNVKPEVAPPARAKRKRPKP